MGDRRKQALRVQFDGKLRLEFHGAKVTSGAGLLAFREMDEAFRLTERGSTLLSDSRRGKNTQHSMLAMLRQGVYGRLAGYEDVNDAERLCVDPAMRQVVGGVGGARRLHQPDGKVRDRGTDANKQPRCPDGPERPVHRRPSR